MARSFRPNFRYLALLSAALAVVAIWTSAVRSQQPTGVAAPAAKASDGKPIAIAETKVTKGQRIVTTTHSFNVFVFQGGRGGARGGVAAAPDLSPLDKLAKEAGFVGQEQVQLQMIGNSTVAQHWERGGDQGPIKFALRNGNVDVFTMTPHREMPEQAIDLFADLACMHNPNIRILCQASWTAWDGTSTDGAGFTNEDHNRLKKQDLNGRIAAGAEDYLVRLREQLTGINQRHGRSIGYVVPVSHAVIQLRVAVLDGKVPGVKWQSDLFSDPMGHPNAYIANLAEYCWFATMYGKSPVGLTSFVNKSDPNSAKAQRVLQNIALDVVQKEPMSGFPKSAAKPVTKAEPKAAAKPEPKAAAKPAAKAPAAKTPTEKAPAAKGK